MNMESNHSQALTSFLVMDFLEKEGVSSALLSNLSQELASRHLFKSMVNIHGVSQPNTYEDLKSQLPPSQKSMLNDLISENYNKQKERVLLKQEKDALIQRIQDRNQVFDKQKRRTVLTRRHSTKNIKSSSTTFDDYPPEIFTDYWGKFKPIFGHLKSHPEPDDPLNGSPVYNLVYDKTGKLVVTAADDGVIKVWSTANGELVNVFMGHTSDINAINLSDCGNYLASCSNDGFVRVWHLETGFPIAVFKDCNGVVCSLNFFNIPVRGSLENKKVRGLATASEEGAVFIYFEEDYINNGGLRKLGQKKMKLRAGDNIKCFCSIEVHPQGFIVAGTSEGYIVVWNRILEIDTKRIERHRICKQEHSKDCHLTVWNKEGNYLLSASFDGTAKIWPWNSDNFESNRDMESLHVFEAELGKRGSEVKCCAVSWSCRSKYAFASFCQTLSKSHEENDVIVTNIQVYDMKLGRRIHKFDRSYDGKPFENYMFILEPHPFNEEIFISADYDGKIVIWDVEHGHILNTFIEDCCHLGFPLCQAPILDGKFAPDGLSFCVTNYHGSFSFYGYGERDLFLTTPTEQFFMKEFTDFEVNPDNYQVIPLNLDCELHFAEKGPLCSSKRKVYSEEYEFNCFSETKQYEKYIKALQRKRYEKKPLQESLNSEDCVKALKTKIKEKIQRETEQALEQFYAKFMEKKGIKESKYRSLSAGKLANVPKGQLKKLAKSVHSAADDADDWEVYKEEGQTELKSRSDEENMLIEDGKASNEVKKGSEGSKKSELDFDEFDEEFQIQQARKKKARRIRLDSEGAGNNEEIFAVPLDATERMEEAERNKKDSRSQKKLRKLVLDEEEPIKNGEEQGHEEKDTRMDEEHTARDETQPLRRSDSERRGDIGIQLVRSESRDVMGRRNRQFANNSSNVREAINTQINLRASLDRALEIQQAEADEDVLCSRCGLENARLKCSNGCGRAYHSGCSKRHCKDTGRETVTCFSCLNKNRKKEKPNGTKVNRSWVDKDSADQMNFIPQVGDLVTYVFQDHEQYIMQYFDFLRFSQDEVFPFEKEKSLLQDNVCRIVDIKYQFPLSPRWYKGPLNVLMKITLQIMEPEMCNQVFFKVTYFQSTLCNFMVSRDLYIKSINRALSLHIGQQVRVKRSDGVKPSNLAEVTPREAGPFPESHWKVLRTHDAAGEAGDKKTGNEQDENLSYASPWELAWNESSFYLKSDQNITREFVQRSCQEISTLYNSHVDKYEIFLEEVDKESYPNYPKIVAFEMNIEKIKRRLMNLHYRHKEMIISDILLIRFNCHRYNEPTSCISIWSNELADNMIHIVDPAVQHRITVPPKVHNPVSVQTKKKLDLHKSQVTEPTTHSREQALEAQQTEDSLPTRSRTRRLQVQGDDDGLEQDKDQTYRSKLRRSNREDQPHFQGEEFSASSNFPTIHNTNAPDYKSRLRRGNESERKAPSLESNDNEGALRLKQRRKEDEFREKMARNFPDAVNRGQRQGEMHNSSNPGGARPVSTRPAQGNQNAIGYKNRLRRKDRRNFAQFFEEDSNEEEESDEEDEEEEKSDKVNRLTSNNNNIREAPVQRNKESEPHKDSFTKTTQGHPVNTTFQHQYIGMGHRMQQPGLAFTDNRQEFKQAPIDDYKDYQPSSPPPMMNEMPRFPGGQAHFGNQPQILIGSNPMMESTNSGIPGGRQSRYKNGIKESESEEESWNESVESESEAESDYDSEDHNNNRARGGNKRQQYSDDEELDEVAGLGYHQRGVHNTNEQDFEVDTAPRRPVNRNKKLKI